ncbi:MAG TPA: hypothetical protein VGI40_04045 [Pirellulaceae bacterium]|jgi:hypothetical protein
MNFASRHWSVVLVWCLATCVLVTGGGCSNRPRNVAKKVSGKVTVGGQPLANALVTFTPANGSPSFGRTDAEGNYNLVWSSQRGRSIEGAQIGEDTVTITTFQPGDPTAKPARAEVPEKVPYKYRQEGGYPKATVKPGANVIDFALDAGPTEAPQPKGKKGKGKGK